MNRRLECGDFLQKDGSLDWRKFGIPYERLRLGIERQCPGTNDHKSPDYRYERDARYSAVTRSSNASSCSPAVSPRR